MLMSTQGPAAFYGVSISLTVLDIIAVCARFWARRKQKQRVKIDDWLVLPALACNIGISIAIWIGTGFTVLFQTKILLTKPGVSRHAIGYPTPPVDGALKARTPLDQVNETISFNEKIFFVVSAIFATSLTCSKTSILCLYRRIFCIEGHWRDATNLTIAFMLIVTLMFGIGVTFATIFACGTHVSIWWATAGAALRAQCIDTQTLTYAQSVADFLIDAIILLIPIPLIWRLHLETRRKWGVAAVFLTASLTVVASLVKMSWFLWENETPWNPSFDQDELASTFLFWTMVETHAALLAINLPTLRVLFRGHRSIDSVLRSIRSKISVNSLGSVHSRTSSPGSQVERLQTKGGIELSDIVVDKTAAQGVSRAYSRS